MYIEAELVADVLDVDLAEQGVDIGSSEFVPVHKVDCINGYVQVLYGYVYARIVVGCKVVDIDQDVNYEQKTVLSSKESLRLCPKPDILNFKKNDGCIERRKFMVIP